MNQKKEKKTQTEQKVLQILLAVTPNRISIQEQVLPIWKNSWQQQKQESIRLPRR